MKMHLWTIIVSSLLAVIIGPVIIPWLKKLKFGQTIYDLGPEAHKKKQGTPTMGGIIFAIPAVIVSFIFFRYGDGSIFPLMIGICALGFGSIGFVDDFIKVKMKRSLGLTPKQKLIPQIILSAVLAVWAYLSPEIGSDLYVPFFNVEWRLGWVYIPIMVFILVGTVNSANLLDGLDGLLGGCSMIDFSAMIIICAMLTEDNPSFHNVATIAASMCGALLGYLFFNGYPARVFMGDVGSFLIGGTLMGIMLVTRLSLLLPLMALAMFMSSLSDIIQMTYFKLTHGKRIFKMAPLHHHFELSGMPETRIVTMYYIATALLSLVCIIGFIQ